MPLGHAEHGARFTLNGIVQGPGVEDGPHLGFTQAPSVGGNGPGAKETAAESRAMSQQHRGTELRRPLVHLVFQEIRHADGRGFRIGPLENLEVEASLSERIPIGLEDVITMVPRSEREPNSIARRLEIGGCADPHATVRHAAHRERATGGRSSLVLLERGLSPAVQGNFSGAPADASNAPSAIKSSPLTAPQRMSKDPRETR